MAFTYNSFFLKKAQPKIMPKMVYCGHIEVKEDGIISLKSVPKYSAKYWILIMGLTEVA